ncbi:MAG: S16 family serine protease [Aquisalimonadaceae bacterium]
MIYTALVSLLTGRCVRECVAMTGEITLRGKEKVLAAQRAGIRDVLLPGRNLREFDDMTENAREQLNVHWIERVEDARDLGLAPDDRDTRGAATRETDTS